MASKFHIIRELYDDSLQRITSSPTEWRGFLISAARNYKLPFDEQLLIHAQRPDATAVLEIERWNDSFGRWVNRGATGIAVIGDAGTGRLKYYFDISDTHETRRSRPVPIWQMREADTGDIIEALGNAFGELEDDSDVTSAIHSAAGNLVADNMPDYFDEIRQLANEGIIDVADMLTLEENLAKTLASSVEYMMASRCGVNVSALDSQDFTALAAFSDTGLATILGEAASAISEMGLREIAATVLSEERTQEVPIRTFASELETRNNQEETLSEKGRSGHDDRDTGIQGSERLQDTDDGKWREADVTGQVGAHEGALPEGDETLGLPSDEDTRDAHTAPDADGERGQGDGGEPDAADGERGERGRDLEGDRPDGLGRQDEQHQKPGGGASPGGGNLQLSFFPTEEEQIESIEAAGKPAAFTISDEILNHELCSGSGFVSGKLRIAAHFQRPANLKDDVAFLKDEYGTGGHTGAIGDAHGFIDHDGKGLKFHIWGDGRDGDREASFKWEFIARRIRELVKAGQYLTADEERELSDNPGEYAEATDDALTIEDVDGEHSLFDIAGSEPAPAQEQEEIAATEPVLTPESFIGLTPTPKPEPQLQPQPKPEPHDYRIITDDYGTGTPKEKYKRNVAAIKLIHELITDGRQATPQEQEVLSGYVGWGGLAEAFDDNNASWTSENAELKDLLSEEEYDAARASTLNAHYTSPVVIKAMYKALSNMGFAAGNVLEPACGIGNFFGLVPESMKQSQLYGVEFDPITGAIAKQLYQSADIKVKGFEETDYPDSFFDVAIGNVPFGSYGVNDKRYAKQPFLIHDYFFAKALDKVRPGGVVAFVTSKGTLDKENPTVRKYLAERADLIGAIRLPDTAFYANAGTRVTADIVFLQKRERPQVVEPDWVHLGKTDSGIPINAYFAEHPDMVLGEMTYESRMYGSDKNTTCTAFEDEDLATLLDNAVANIHAEITDFEREDDEEQDNSIPADPAVKNFSFAEVDGHIYFREDSRMYPRELSATATSRVKGMIAIRDCVRKLIDLQTEDAPDSDVASAQAELNRLYDAYTGKYGLINSRGNATAFSDDSAYPILCSLEVLDAEGNFERKADMFSKRTIAAHIPVTHADTASEALALSLAEKAKVDLAYMAELTGKDEQTIVGELEGVIFKEPLDGKYVTADEYLSGNVREKLKVARLAADSDPALAINVRALEQALPKDLDASEINVRLGATWVTPEDYEQFTYELLDTPMYHRSNIAVHYSPATAEWNISGKSRDSNNVKALSTYGTHRKSAYEIIEATLNLRDVKIFDYKIDEEGKKKAVLNKKETAIASSKQEDIKQAFKDWIWKDPERRQRLTRYYNDTFNSFRQREFNGDHLVFPGMNPEIELKPHQRNAIARVLYGGNTLLAHVVGAGKTYEMVAASQELKRLGLCNKSLIVVPNHLTEQWASDYLQLYPSANILVATKKDFERKRRRRFCARIATGDYDAIIIGHSQFEKIPMSIERQRAQLEDQIDEIVEGIEELKSQHGERFTVKQLEKTKKSLQVKLEKLNDQSRKDDVVTFEELGVDRLFIDESHYYKNLFLYSKMRNVGGIAQTEAQKSSDLFMKCRYLDEITGGKGVVFATGTPVSNSMVELYTVQRYLQYGELQRMGLAHFDCWASTFGETVTAVDMTRNREIQII